MSSESTKLDIQISPNSSQTLNFDEISEKNFTEIQNPNEVEIYQNEIKNLPKLQYGKYITFYYKNNDPLFAIGPDWPFFAILFTLNILFDIFISSMLWENSYLAIKILGIISS